MFAQVFTSVFQAISWVWNLFFQISNAFGFAGLLFQMFAFFCVYRFLLKPLFGLRGSSDKVKKPKNEQDV